LANPSAQAMDLFSARSNLSQAKLKIVGLPDGT